MEGEIVRAVSPVETRLGTAVIHLILAHIAVPFKLITAAIESAHSKIVKTSSAV